MIVVENLSRQFGSFTAVDNLSFTVAPGEVLGFLGPNGAGKSTTMKMLAGFLRPTGGHVDVFGLDMWKQPLPAKKLLGYLPEGAPGYGEMTVKGFLEFIAAVRGFSGAEKQRRVAVAADKIALQEVMQQTLDTLSKGYRRRVGLAQAILHDPRVLILDEPTDGLDPNQKHQVRELIRHLSNDKLVIVSTHILEEVAAVCSRAMLIAKGRLLIDATPAELEAKSRYHGAVSLLLQAGVALSAADILRHLPGVADVEQDAQGRFTLFPAEKADVMVQVQAAASEHGWVMQGLHVERGRLDDVFRSLTGGV
jgi:ABC-2 type transport system ATP-binding protein